MKAPSPGSLGRRDAPFGYNAMVHKFSLFIMKKHQGLRPASWAIALLSLQGSLSWAGVVIPEPLAISPLPIRADKVETAPIAPKALPTAKSPAWLTPLPSTVGRMCFSGVCLGDSVDRLPAVAVNGRSVKAPGQWHVNMGPAIAATDLDNVQRTSADKDLFEAMKKLQRSCALPASVDSLKPKMRLVFTPEDGSLEGLEVVAELLPKKEDFASSAYAITQIRMSMRQVPAELALEWPDQVSEMWPGLGATIAEGSKRLPDTYLQWSASTPLPKSVSDLKKSSVVYTVEPSLAVEDDEFNAKRWARGLVTHELIWSHGIGRSLPSMLAQQPGCSSP